MALSRYNTNLDSEVLNAFREKVKSDGITQREVLEALMEAYCRGEFTVETEVQRKIKFK